MSAPVVMTCTARAVEGDGGRGGAVVHEEGEAEELVAAGSSAVTSCSKTAPLTSSTTRSQIDEAFGAAAMVRVPEAMIAVRWPRR